ncbi:MAG: hypothetical protein M3P44_17375 [Actinomycetota bacterium]|nr:hypothetical protein [Actinomycetota bacterium]
MARAGRHPHPDNGMVGVWSVGLASDLPDEAGQLARDGNRDSRAALGAAGVEVRPAAGEAKLRTPGGLDRGRRLTGLAATQGERDGGPAAVVPGRLDEQSAGVA